MDAGKFIGCLFFAGILYWLFGELEGEQNQDLKVTEFLKFLILFGGVFFAFALGISIGQQGE